MTAKKPSNRKSIEYTIRALNANGSRGKTLMAFSLNKAKKGKKHAK